MRDEILEFPYIGTITHVVRGEGREPDKEVVVYNGKMDIHTQTDEEGKTLQTAKYIVSMPLTRNVDGAYIIPHKGDKISVTRYGETFALTVDNSEPSQIGGVSIYATRNSW